jgi:hypothetical protein
VIKIKLTKGHFAIIDEKDFVLVSRYNWHATNHDNVIYAATRMPDANLKYKYMHQLILGLDGQTRIDHKNRNGLDNRRTNLRICPNLSSNSMNRGKQSNNLSSKFKGVTWDKNRNKWKMQIKFRDTRIQKRFDTEEQAAVSYNHFVNVLCPEFGVLNNIESQRKKYTTK